MNELETKEINLWTCTEEEEMEWKRAQDTKRKRIEASPKFRYGSIRSDTLIDIIFSTPFPKPVVSPEEIEALRTPDLLAALGARGALPESPAVFNSIKADEKWRETSRSLQWLRYQAYSYHIDKRKIEPTPDVLDARNWRQCIEMLNDFKISFRIGAALAIYEQMDRAGHSEPSLSKAHWLLAKAPDLEGFARPGFGSPDDIARAWKHHYHFAHYWAAYVAMTGEPFSFDPATVLRFACKASLGRFRRFAATYLEFRRGVVPPRSKQKGYITQGLDDYNNIRDIANARPIARELLPNFVNAEQWRALNDYRAPVRKSRG